MSTWFVLALNIISCDGAVSIKAHSPAERNGPIFNLADLYLRRVGWFWGKVQRQLSVTILSSNRAEKETDSVKGVMLCSNYINKQLMYWEVINEKFMEGNVSPPKQSWATLLNCVWMQFTLHCQLYDASVLAKRVDGMTGEEARVLAHCRHNLQRRTKCTGHWGGHTVVNYCSSYMGRFLNTKSSQSTHASTFLVNFHQHYTAPLFCALIIKWNWLSLNG